jgi:uncharacterized protein DUF2249
MSETGELILDVREDLASGQHPLEKIVKTAESVPKGGSFTLIAPFEPLPLFGVLGQLGFSYESEAIAGGGCRVLFTRNRLP